MSLLQDRYALGYEWGGVLLAGVERGKSAVRLYNGYADRAARHAQHDAAAVDRRCGGYFAMALTGNPWLLVLAFGLVGAAKGCVLNTDSVLVAISAEDRTQGMNLAHSRFALGSLVCPLLIAALGLLHWRAPMIGLGLCGCLLWLELLRGADCRVGEPDGGTAGDSGTFSIPAASGC